MTNPPFHPVRQSVGAGRILQGGISSTGSSHGTTQRNQTRKSLRIMDTFWTSSKKAEAVWLISSGRCIWPQFGGTCRYNRVYVATNIHFKSLPIATWIPIFSKLWWTRYLICILWSLTISYSVDSFLLAAQHFHVLYNGCRYRLDDATLTRFSKCFPWCLVLLIYSCCYTAQVSRSHWNTLNISKISHLRHSLSRVGIGITSSRLGYLFGLRFRLWVPLYTSLRRKRRSR